MINRDQLHANPLIKFVGPRDYDDPEVLKEGETYVVKEMYRDVVVLLTGEGVEFRVLTVNRVLNRFVLYSKLKEVTTATIKELDVRFKEFEASFGKENKAWNDSQMSPEAKAENEQRMKMYRQLKMLKGEKVAPLPDTPQAEPIPVVTEREKSIDNMTMEEKISFIRGHGGAKHGTA